MAKKSYIVCIDRDDEVNYLEFHKNFTALPDVLTWSHYMKSWYLIISELDANAISKKIFALLPTDKRLLVIEVNLKNRNGKLPPKAWEWIKKHQKTEFP